MLKLEYVLVLIVDLLVFIGGKSSFGGFFLSKDRRALVDSNGKNLKSKDRLPC